MENIFSVAIHYNDIIGYIEYTADKKAAKIVLADEAAKASAEKFLREEHEMQIPHKTLHDFTKEKIQPLADIESFKLALTRMWEVTRVHIDWSRPVDYVKAHPTIKD